MDLTTRAYVIDQVAKQGAGKLPPPTAQLGIAITALTLGAYFPKIARALVEHVTDKGLTTEMAVADLVYTIGVNLHSEEDRLEWARMLAEEGADADVEAAYAVIHRLRGA